MSNEKQEVFEIPAGSVAAGAAQAAPAEKEVIIGYEDEGGEGGDPVPIEIGHKPAPAKLAPATQLKAVVQQVKPAPAKSVPTPHEVPTPASARNWLSLSRMSPNMLGVIAVVVFAVGGALFYVQHQRRTAFNPVFSRNGTLPASARFVRGPSNFPGLPNGLPVGNSAYPAGSRHVAAPIPGNTLPVASPVKVFTGGNSLPAIEPVNLTPSKPAGGQFLNLAPPAVAPAAVIGIVKTGPSVPAVANHATTSPVSNSTQGVSSPIGTSSNGTLGQIVADVLEDVGVLKSGASQAKLRMDGLDKRLVDDEAALHAAQSKMDALSAEIEKMTAQVGPSLVHKRKLSLSVKSGDLGPRGDNRVPGESRHVRLKERRQEPMEFSESWLDGYSKSANSTPSDHKDHSWEAVGVIDHTGYLTHRTATGRAYTVVHPGSLVPTLGRVVEVNPGTNSIHFDDGSELRVGN